MTNEKDCIYREETLNKINALIAEYIPLMPIGWTLPLNIAKTINEMPTVTPSRPKGKWILIHPLQEDDDGAYICSNCEHGDWDCDTSYKYCPNCGADMRESEDSK